jgi:tRNA(Leu) C34 or U34 (ribose-2'-O)-methylase TrmL
VGKIRQRDLKPFLHANEVHAALPALVLTDPRYPHNVGAAVRAASCFGVEQVWVTGRRVADQVWNAKRLPREERMKGFSDVRMVLEDRPFDHFPKDAVPVAVDLIPGAENLLTFEDPENAVYVFGPEDGSVPKPFQARCHRRVFIPTKHCTNLGAAVYLILYDRLRQDWHYDKVPAMCLDECLKDDRPTGWAVDDDPDFEARR